MREPAAMEPEQFAALVAATPDAQLSAGLRQNGPQILDAVFAAMPASFIPERAVGVDAVVEWRIVDGKHEVGRWQLAIGGGRCEVRCGGGADPDVSYSLSALSFLKLSAGVVSGQGLFARGRLRISGNLALAVRMPALFRLPASGSGRGP